MILVCRRRRCRYWSIKRLSGSRLSFISALPIPVLGTITYRQSRPPLIPTPILTPIPILSSTRPSRRRRRHRPRLLIRSILRTRRQSIPRRRLIPRRCISRRYTAISLCPRTHIHHGLTSGRLLIVRRTPRPYILLSGRDTVALRRRSVVTHSTSSVSCLFTRSCCASIRARPPEVRCT